MSGFRDALHRNRLTVAVAIGFALVGIPTYFALYPPVGNTPPWYVRAVIALLWSIGAIIVTVGAERRGRAIDDLSAGQQAIARNLRVAALRRCLTALLAPGTAGIPTTFEFTVYVHDADSKTLRPIFPIWDATEGEDPRVFAPGKGATGKAWSDDAGTFVVLGDKVHSAAHGLTPLQQDYFRAYRAVAATPIRWLATQRKGVLTALSPAEDDYFDSDPGTSVLESLANTLGVVLETLGRDEEA